MRETESPLRPHRVAGHYTVVFGVGLQTVLVSRQGGLHTCANPSLVRGKFPSLSSASLPSFQIFLSFSHDLSSPGRQRT
jgi:hypothetical protein